MGETKKPKARFALARSISAQTFLVVFIFVVSAAAFFAWRLGQTTDRVERNQQHNCAITNANDAAFNKLLDQLSFNLRKSTTQTAAEKARGLALYASARRTLESC